MQTKLLMALVLAASSCAALAALPPPTPAQVEQQKAKKAIADAQAEQDKQALLGKMDALAASWRAKAPAKGWKVNAPTALPAPAAAVTAAANQSAPSGQPDGKMTATGAAAPMTSEKAGSAGPSADTKTAPSPAASTVKTK
jgi:hypothetical protein